MGKGGAQQRAASSSFPTATSSATLSRASPSPARADAAHADTAQVVGRAARDVGLGDLATLLHTAFMSFKVVGLVKACFTDFTLARLFALVGLHSSSDSSRVVPDGDHSLLRHRSQALPFSGSQNLSAETSRIQARRHADFRQATKLVLVGFRFPTS